MLVGLIFQEIHIYSKRSYLSECSPPFELNMTLETQISFINNELLDKILENIIK